MSPSWWRGNHFMHTKCCCSQLQHGEELKPLLICRIMPLKANSRCSTITINVGRMTGKTSQRGSAWRRHQRYFLWDSDYIIPSNTHDSLLFPPGLSRSSRTAQLQRTPVLRSVTSSTTFSMWGCCSVNTVWCLCPYLMTELCCPFQLVMQYLYCGGTESLHIRNTEVMEVREAHTCVC